VAVSDLDNRTGSLADEPYAIAWDAQDRPADESILWHDLNADGIVDDQDMGVLMNNLLVGQKSPEAYVIGDINMDGSIDVNDVIALNVHRNRKADWYGERAAN